MSENHSTDFARQLELAWAAGFYDGEGWACLGKCSHRKDWNRFSLGVGQSELGPLERFRVAVGLGRITGPYVDPKRPNTKPFWRWMCSGFPAKEVLASLWPYLTDVKKAQAQQALDGEVNSGKPLAQNRTHCVHGHDYREHAHITKEGHRKCRVCIREQGRVKSRRHREKLKAAKEES